MEPALFSVFCTGFDDTGSHVEYIFHVVHLPSGCAWKVRRRYSELLCVHDLLSGRVGKLPIFPPKALHSLSLLFGHNLAVERVSAFQEYFQRLLSRNDIAVQPELQHLLGVQRPASLTAFVRRWVIDTDSCTADLELEITVEAYSPAEEGHSPYAGTTTSCAPAESVLVQRQGANEAEPLACGKPNKPLWVRRLPCGEEIALEVMAANSVGRSDPFDLRLLAPGERAIVLDPGRRVRAVWAGDGKVYDAVVRSHQRSSGFVLVDWLRPAPLSGEKLTCVCEVGDDTDH